MKEGSGEKQYGLWLRAITDNRRRPLRKGNNRQDPEGEYSSNGLNSSGGLRENKREEKGGKGLHTVEEVREERVGSERVLEVGDRKKSERGGDLIGIEREEGVRRFVTWMFVVRSL